MSSREHLQKIAGEAIVAEMDWRYVGGAMSDHDRDLMAKAALDAILPQITDPKQLLGVPEGSFLYTVTRPNPTFYRLQGGKLQEAGSIGPDWADFEPRFVINDEGPLTVVWMP